MTKIPEFGIICDNVRFLRKREGLSRTAMAKRLHITCKTLDLLEGGLFPERCGIGFVMYACEAFQIPPQQFVAQRLENNTCNYLR